MNNRDIVKFAMIKNMPGILDESARLHVGVKTGDAGVMGELLQAACDPSAGQQALQAGEAVQQPCLAEERRFELKRKADYYELELAERHLQVEERQIILQKQKLEHVDHFIETMTRVNPDWRADARLTVQVQDLLCAAFVTEQRLVTAQGSAAPENVVAPEGPGAPDCAVVPERPGAPESHVVSQCALALESVMASESAAAARLESVSLAVREMMHTVKLRLEMLTPDAVAKVSAGDSGAVAKVSAGDSAGVSAEASGAGAAGGGDAPGAVPQQRGAWRGKMCIHRRRGYRCKLCIKA
jgi:hypothetical protein